MTIINVIRGDSYKSMESIFDNKYQLAIVDVPYGIGMDNNAGKSTKYKNKKWDNACPTSLYFDQLKRISENQIIWGANHFIDAIPFNTSSSCWIVWDKREIVIPSRTFADGEIAWTSFNSPLRIFRHYWDGFLQKNKEIRIHVTQKPVALYKYLLKNYAKPGDKIFDSHGGSMSHAIAAIDMGFDLDIYEIDDDYYNDAADRIKRHLNQLDLTRSLVQVNFIEQ